MLCTLNRVYLVPVVIILAILHLYIELNKLSDQEGPPIKLDANAGLEDLYIDQLAEEFMQKYGSSRVIEASICLEGETRCVEVRDFLLEYYHGRYSFWRVLYYDKYELTSGLLKAPTKKIADYLDTTKWEVDMAYVHPGVGNDVAIREMFASGAIEMSRDAKANILVIGLGAGHINTFLYLTYPNLNITAIEMEWPMIRVGLRWFGLKIDGRHTVELMDAIPFLKTAAISGQKYDVIHIDACTLNFDDEINCPTKAFLLPSVVKNIHQLLSDKGVVTMNVISVKAKEAGIKMVKDAFDRFFRECNVELVPLSEPNVILSCTRQLRPKGLKEKYNKFIGRKE
ncbi:hypothetical protein Q1695_015700 [Nippostrongylus brasiliensis]|nr:hypothetical protein Q1695_015700 [Nippostrongylus brasiliensis]